MDVSPLFIKLIRENIKIINTFAGENYFKI